MSILAGSEAGDRRRRLGREEEDESVQPTFVWLLLPSSQIRWFTVAQGTFGTTQQPCIPLTVHYIIIVLEGLCGMTNVMMMMMIKHTKQNWHPNMDYSHFPNEDVDWSLCLLELWMYRSTIQDVSVRFGKIGYSCW